MKTLWQNEPARVSAGFIALVAVIRAFLRWGGVEVPDEVDNTVQFAIAAWVGIILRERVAPVVGPQNAPVAAGAATVERREKVAQAKQDAKDARD